MEKLNAGTTCKCGPLIAKLLQHYRDLVENDAPFKTLNSEIVNSKTLFKTQDPENCILFRGIKTLKTFKTNKGLPWVFQHLHGSNAESTLEGLKLLMIKSRCF